MTEKTVADRVTLRDLDYLMDHPDVTDVSMDIHVHTVDVTDWKDTTPRRKPVRNTITIRVTSKRLLPPSTFIPLHYMLCIKPGNNSIMVINRLHGGPHGTPGELEDNDPYMFALSTSEYETIYAIGGPSPEEDRVMATRYRRPIKYRRVNKHAEGTVEGHETHEAGNNGEGSID